MRSMGRIISGDLQRADVPRDLQRADVPRLKKPRLSEFSASQHISRALLDSNCFMEPSNYG